MTPRISVVMGVFNDAACVPAAIESIRAQSLIDWERDPARLANRIQLLQALWSSALRAGVPESAAERQHFARWSFAMARRCAAVGLVEDMQIALTLAQQAAGTDGRGAQGIAAFRLLARSIGAVATGRLSRTIESLGWQPGGATLPQSFSSC